MDNTMEIKTYINWINSSLQRHDITVKDLNTDLCDGIVLLSLGSELSGREPPKHNTTPDMRVKKIENVNTALRFFRSFGVILHNIGAEAVVDGNERTILGMIWQLIHHFRVRTIHYVEGEAAEKNLLSGEEALLKWCQMSVADYDHVSVTNFTTSWRDGLALCAIVDNYFPNEIDWNTIVNQYTPAARLSHAFAFLQSTIKVPALLDVQDLVDEKTKINAHSVILYVAMLQATIKTRLDADKTHEERNKEMQFVKTKLAKERQELETRLQSTSEEASQNAEERQAALERLADIQTKLVSMEDEKAAIMRRLEAEAQDKARLALSLQAEAEEKARLAQVLQAEAAEKSRLAADLTASAEEKDHLLANLANTAEQAQALIAKLEAEKQQAHELQQRLKQEAEERAKLSAQLEMTAEEKARLEAERQKLATDLATQEAEKSNLQQMRDRLQNDLSQNQQMLETLEAASSSMKVQLKQEETRRRAFQDESQQLNKSLRDLKERLANETDNAQQQLQMYEEKMQQMAAMLQREHDQVTTLQLARNKALDDLQAMKKLVKEMTQRLQEYKLSMAREIREREGDDDHYDRGRSGSVYVGEAPPVLPAFTQNQNKHRKSLLPGKRARKYTLLEDFSASITAMEKEGWLSKESGSNKGRFERRYFRLQGFNLSYFKDPNDKEPRKTIPLSDSVHILFPTDPPHAFVVLSSAHNNRKFVIAASSEKEKSDWVCMLQEKLGCATYIKHMQALGEEPDPRVLAFFSRRAYVQLRLEGVANPLETVSAIAVPLQNHTALEVVSLEGSALKDVEVEVLCKAISFNSSIHTLVLRNNLIKNDGAKAIAEMLQTNKTVRVIDLSHNQLENLALQHLGMSLKYHPMLSTLDLASNCIGDEGVKKLCEGLSPNHQMPELQLANNYVGVEGAAAVGHLLETNSSITTVDLNNNAIGDQGFIELCSCVIENHTLKTLKLSENGLTDDMGDALGVVLSGNRSIEVVELSGNAIGPSLVTAMQALENQTVFYARFTLERKLLDLSS